MSASTQKKLRQQQREDGVEKHQVAKIEADKKAKKSKFNTILASTFVIVLLLATIGWSLANSFVPAAKVGGHSVKAPEYSYYYSTTVRNYANQMGDFFSYIIDTTKSLDKQAYGEDMTWQDYFEEQTLATMKNTYMLNDEADKAGFELSEEEQAELNSIIESYASAHVSLGYPSADAYLGALFGSDVDLEVVTGCVTKSYTAQQYSMSVSDSFEYSDEELTAHYEENLDDYDSYTFVSHYLSAAADTENDITAEDAMKAAEENAEKILDGAKDEEAFIANVKEVADADASAYTTKGTDVSGAYTEWVKDSARKSGDTTSIKTEDGVYVLYFVERVSADYKTQNVRHILVKAEGVVGEDGQTTYSDEAKAEAKEKAEALLEEYLAGDKTEDSFATLATENTEDAGSKTTGGLYENVSMGRMVPEFDAWIYDNHSAGDTGIVFYEGTNYCGYHVMYYVGEGTVYANSLADNDLRSADYQEWQAPLLESYDASASFSADGVMKKFYF